MVMRWVALRLVRGLRVRSGDDIAPRHRTLGNYITQAGSNSYSVAADVSDSYGRGPHASLELVQIRPAGRRSEVHSAGDEHPTVGQLRGLVAGPGGDQIGGGVQSGE